MLSTNRERLRFRRLVPMLMKNSHDLTRLLVRWREGEPRAAEELWTRANGELRRLAAHYMRSERRDHTLQATALVNELFLRFFTSQPVQCQDRVHFFALAGQQIRHILVNHARDRQAMKRGGRRVRLSLSELNGLGRQMEPDVLDLELALQKLEQLDSRAAQAVELRFFGGLTEAEAAEVLGVSPATLKRDWEFARVWLLRELSRPDEANR